MLSFNRFFIFLVSISIIVTGNATNCLAKTVEKIDKTTSTTSGNALSIVAIVDGQAITSFDVDSRVKFIITTTGISNTTDMLKNIRPQVIRTLIDESLEMQEATRNNIIIDDKEVAQAIATIEVQRGMPSGGIASILRANQIPEKTFNDQIRTQLAWGKLLGKNIRGRIKISDDEITLAKGYIASPVSSEVTPVVIKEMEIAVISLPVDKREHEAEIKKLSDKLSNELRKGVGFNEIARQFSSGGDGKSFWIRPEQLEPIIAQVLKTTREGSITAPIRTHDGFSIIKLLHVRTHKNPIEDINKNNKHGLEITLKEILLKLKPTASRRETDVLLQIGEEIAKNPGNCEEKGVASIDGLEDFDIEVSMRKSLSSELPPALRSISDSLKLGGISIPFASEAGIRLYMLCGKEEIVDAPSVQNIDKIREGLFKQKFELEAQKYLRDLRRQAFIDIRE